MEYFLSLLNEIALPVGAGAIIVFGWQISRTVGKLEGRMDGMQTQLAKLTDDVLGIREDMRDIRREMHDLRTEVGTLRSDVDKLSVKVDGMGTRLDGVDTRLQRIESSRDRD